MDTTSQVLNFKCAFTVETVAEETKMKYKTVGTYIEDSNGKLIAKAIVLKGKSVIEDQENEEKAKDIAKLIASLLTNCREERKI